MDSKQNNPAWSKVAEVELTYKGHVKASERPLITSSKDGYDTFLKVWDESKLELQEEFKVLLLNQANRVIGVYPASSGGITGTVADPRLILVAALKVARFPSSSPITTPAVT